MMNRKSAKAGDESWKGIDSPTRKMTLIVQKYGLPPEMMPGFRGMAQRLQATPTPSMTKAQKVRTLWEGWVLS
jgi:hypothetical protein